jgi:hypothetical protein
VIVAGLLLLPLRAHAESPAEPEKSPRTATALSTAPTLVGIGLVGAGLYVANLDCSTPGCTDHFDTGLYMTIAGGALLGVGPSLGHIYAGDAWTTGLKVRLIGVGVAGVGGLVAAAAPSDCDGFVCPGQGIGMLVAIGGAITYVTGAIMDATSAGAAVEARNATQIVIAPLGAPRGYVPGIAFTRAF